MVRLDLLRIQPSAGCSQVHATKEVQANSAAAGVVEPSPAFFRVLFLSWSQSPIKVSGSFVKIEAQIAVDKAVRATVQQARQKA
jgi:hypothetical protein